MFDRNKEIEEAIKVHLEWVGDAKKLTSGQQPSALPAIRHTECKLGRMIGRGMLVFCDPEITDDINTAHFLLHDMYKNIYDILADNPNPTPEERERCDSYFELLEEISDTIIDLLKKCKQP